MNIERFLFLLLIVLRFHSVEAQTQTVGIFLNDSLSFNGYTLFAPTGYNHVYLIGNCGYKVNQWECGDHDSYMAYLLDDGSMIRTGVVQSANFQGGGMCGIVDCYSWEGDLLWEFEYHDSQHHQHHDIAPMPNGNFLIIAWVKYSAAEAIAKGKDPSMLQGGELWMDHILEIEPGSGNIVWEWSSWDHLIQDFDPGMENFGVVTDHPERIDINYNDESVPVPGDIKDWMHVNSIDYNADLDQILISVRNYSEVWIIDHSTTTVEAAGSTGGIYGKGGDLLYRWGNPEAYGRGGSNDQILYYMHDPTWIPDDYPDGGKILVFNNQHTSQQSSVLVFNPPFDAPGFYTDPGDEAFGPETHDWIYLDSTLFGKNISGSQRLPNGNTLICEGPGGTFTEVTYEDKEIVWEYRSPVNLFGPISQGEPPNDISQFKIRRYGPGFSGFEGKEMIPGDPVELDPWNYDCTIYPDTMATSVEIIAESSDITLTNPFSDKLVLCMNTVCGGVIQVYNNQGVLMVTEPIASCRHEISALSWPAGFYILKIKRTGLPMQTIKVVKLD
ncbi:MAG: aryl-sulfate sulfotransferase [Bacteroidales bacterium]|nr:aryl-sulfate sulfotransferase [Bacteroidales bacterium]